MQESQTSTRVFVYVEIFFFWCSQMESTGEDENVDADL